VDGSWRGNPAGNLLLEDAAADRARGEYAKQVFESAFGTGAAGSAAGNASQAAAFSRSSADLPTRAARAVGAWQEHLARLAAADDQEPETKRIAFDDESLGLVVVVAMLGEGAPGAVPVTGTPVTDRATEAEGTSIYTEPRRLLASVFGTGRPAGILAQARADLIHRIRLLLDEELVRFAEVIESAGPCDDVAAIRLYQAEYSLEAVR